jgi:type II secretory pathway predicted ATPase ExeA
MDREQHFKPDAPILPSRQPALAAMTAVHDDGPILITGEPGIGKTWLAHRFGLITPRTPRWLEVDLTPSTERDDLFRSIANGLGLDDTVRSRHLRFTIAQVLAEESIEGRRWGLVIDEAQVASSEMLEEIRVLCNRLGRADGFATIVILGQTPLSRRLDRRALSALEARLAAQIHLRPIDADEANLLLDHAIGVGVFAADEVDDLHRASSGNPQRLLRLAAASLGTRVGLEGPRGSSPSRTAASPPILPSRPPLRVEEGMIEVGWDSEPDAAPATTPGVAAVRQPVESATVGDRAAESSSETAVADHPVADHYAALQAWNEWAENHGRGPTVESSDPNSVLDLGQERDAPAGATTLSPIGEHPQVWAEGQQGFAPYSQLFSRLRPHRDLD